jgi:hypothetical protein
MAQTYARELGFQPGFQRSDDRGPVLTPGGEARTRLLAADGLLDPIKQRDLAQHFLGDRRALTLEVLHEAAADMRPAIDQLPWAIVARDFGHRVVGLVGIALQQVAAVSGEEVQRMRPAPAGGIVEQHDRWTVPAMTTVISDDGPEEAGLGAF